jgi:hypothetical protein
VNSETEKILRGFAYMGLGDGHATVPASIASINDVKQVAMMLLADYDLPEGALIVEETAEGVSIRPDREIWGGFIGYRGTDAAP